RFTGFGIGHGIKLQVTDPFVGRLNRLELEAEGFLVYAEHAVEDALVREEDAELLGINSILLRFQVVAEVTPIPDVDFSVGVAGFLDFDFAEFVELGVEFWLEAG